MDADDIVLSEFAQELCQDLNIEHAEVVDVVLNTEPVFPDSAAIDGRTVYWGPERPDGTHLHVVCSPEPHIVNDLRALRNRPSYANRFPDARFPQA